MRRNVTASTIRVGGSEIESAVIGVSLQTRQSRRDYI
jgi:hypothetical protein